MNYLNCNPSPQLKSKSTAILESVCTEHFLVANAHCNEKQLADPPLEVRLPTGLVITSTHTVTLDIPYLPMVARYAHVTCFGQHPLLSVGKMRDNGCAITFTSNKVTIKHGMVTILDGTCATDSGLWRVPLGEPTPGHALPLHTVHNIYEKSQSKTQLLIFMGVSSALCNTLGSKLLKMGTLQHGHI
jgi:hypothetical protein